MALESGTYINSLVATNPVSTDGLAAADDHMRLIKATILASFPNITGAMTATHAVLNGLDARVTAIETAFATGTKMLFVQTAAPTGWTKDTTNNDDSAIRVVTGTAGTGGTNAFSTVDATASGTINSSISGSTAGHTLTTNQIPSHSHSMGSNSRVQLGFDNGTAYSGRWSSNAHGNITYSTQNTGGGGSHSHGVGSLTVTSTFTGAANALDVKYVDVIIATKD